MAARKSAKKQGRRGLPAPESVVEEKVFVSPGGSPYRILRTTEVDEYEEKKKGPPAGRRRKTK